MQDEVFMRKAIELSKLAVEHGNEPFGAVLVKDGEIVFTNENQIYTKHDQYSLRIGRLSSRRTPSVTSGCQKEFCLRFCICRLCQFFGITLCYTACRKIRY